MLWGQLMGVVFKLVCAARTDMHLRMLERQSDLRIEPAQNQNYNYVVRLSNVLDLGYDPDIKRSRDETALRAMRAQCPKAKIVGEDVLEKGSYGLRPAREYLIQIKC